MTLVQVLILILATLLIAWLFPIRWRPNALLVSSIVAIYWLQFSTPIRNLDFWFPTASIALTVLVWAIAFRSPEDRQSGAPLERGKDLWAGALIFGTVFLIGLTRYLGPVCCLTPSRPPAAWQILFLIAAVGGAAAIRPRLLGTTRFLLSAAILFLVALFITLKSEPLGYAASAWLRLVSGQSADLASHLDLRWLGFSYLAFRLLHVLRDVQLGRLPGRMAPYTLGEFVTYAIFFPAYTAGPIDRSQHFITELRSPAQTSVQPDSPAEERIIGSRLSSANLIWGMRRILIGLFKKFVLADSLALVSLNVQNASQVNSPLWMWVLLYAYSLRIYFDFSGYTDLALGLGRLVGFDLPENFDRPYLRTNLTTFWNSWHITLAQWFRAYFFNPLTRFFRSRPQKWPAWVVLLAAQFSTMLLIGLWHGITWNFAIWGAWHGVGLFIHNRWTDWRKTHSLPLLDHPRLQRLWSFGGWALTFHFVTLGWVWFVLPEPVQAWSVFQRLFAGL